MLEFPKKSYKRQQNIDIADGLLQSVIIRSLCLELLTLNSFWASKGLQYTIFTWLNVYAMVFITFSIKNQHGDYSNVTHYLILIVYVNIHNFEINCDTNQVQWLFKVWHLSK